MDAFEIYPAIDLRQGKVVRLVQGDPNRQTTYSSDPAAVALRWVEAGANWLHVVNLDGALEEQGCDQNQAALATILQVVEGKARVQFGGGLRSLEALETILQSGVQRAVLGTAALEQPGLVVQALQRFGLERIAAALDVRDGFVRVRGWKASGGWSDLALGKRLAKQGLRWVIYTNIQRDGAGRGVDVAAARRLMLETGLQVIASGGVHTLTDVQQVKEASLAGLVIGKALYDGKFTLEEALRCTAV